MIEVERLYKKFGEVEALRGVTFTVEEGTIFGLLGLNGAGKTTCLRILSTVLIPTSGKVRILGEDPFQKGVKLRKKMGVLSSETHLPGRFTPRELAEMVAQLYDFPRWEKPFSELTEKLRMTDDLDRPIATFSTGMKQKTALLLCFLHNPPVLLLDEPTAGLDIPSAKTVKDFLHAHITQGKTVLICSHHLHEVQALCQKLAIIHKGRICVQGEIKDLLKETSSNDLEEVFLKFVGDESNKEL